MSQKRAKSDRKDAVIDYLLEKLIEIRGGSQGFDHDEVKSTLRKHVEREIKNG